MINPIHKATMLKQVREHGKWTGYMALCNVSAFHINGGWHLGIEITVTGGKDGYYIETPNGNELMENYVNSFLYYNGNNELGKRVRFWEE